MVAQRDFESTQGTGAAPHIVWLGQPACHVRARTGGKAAYLSALAADFRVPIGFCLTTTAFKVAKAGRIDVQSVTPGTYGLPGWLRTELVDAYTTLAKRCGVAAPPVAVRSSAVDEDSSRASFAGQHDTFLNVIGVEAVAEAVMHCWRSAGSSRVQAYRREQGLAGEDSAIAVLVQHLVNADVSAVVFSANPVSGNQDELVINASWGLGESIVGGTVAPDTYMVHKTDMQIVSRRIAEKRRMTVPTDGGTREVDVPRFLRVRPALDDQQVAEVARLGLALESRMGWPVDVECAYQADALFLLQCRPITTLSGR